MQCPICTVELKLADRQGVEIDYCPKCRGVWLDRGELDKLIERTMQADNQFAVAPRRDGREDHPSDYDDDAFEYKDAFGYKRKNDDQYRREDHSHPQQRQKKSFLSEIFDIFD